MRVATVSAPVERNVNVAAMERLERRALPQTPWPDVQPDPIREPIPTANPPVINNGKLLVTVITGTLLLA